MTLAPVVLFTYNRPEHTRQAVEALARNELAAESDLIVFSDGPKTAQDAEKVNAVRAYLQQLEAFKSVEIRSAEINRGLANSIIAGVTSVCDHWGRVIVLEDDLVTSKYFLRYMNEGLEQYEAESSVASIHGYVYPIKEVLPETFFLRGADCWGWATWKRAWDLFNPDGGALLLELEQRQLTHEFDFNGTVGYIEMLRGQVAGVNDSWAIRWHASAFLLDKLTLYPGRSLLQNIGVDGSGRHCGAADSYATTLSKEPIRLSALPPAENLQARRAIENFFRHLTKRPSILDRITSRLRRGGLGTLSSAEEAQSPSKIT